MASQPSSYSALERGDAGNGKAAPAPTPSGDGKGAARKVGDVVCCCMELVFHGAYFAIAAAVIITLKATLVDQNRDTLIGMFLCGVNMSKLWTTLIGIGVPVLLSLRALVTLETDDDHYWLTYWTVYAFYTFLTIIFEEILFEDTWLWYAIQGAIYVWLYFPWLHGCMLISDGLLKPTVLPLINMLVKWLRANLTLSLLLGSFVNIAFIFTLFLFLIPFCSTYIGTTMVGISYPFFCSLATISQKTDAEVTKDSNDNDGTGRVSDTQWLTYWLVFAFVHFTNVWYDNLLDESYWFRDLWYKFALPFVVWLQIPFFKGAEYIFLNIICPIFGLHVHRFHYNAAPWQEAPQAVNYITYSKNISGFINLVQGIDGKRTNAQST